MNAGPARQAALRVIADPTRREILHILADREVAASEVAASFEMTRSAVSQHLSVLAAVNLVTVRKDGTRRLYKVNQEELRELLKWLDGYWSTGLFRLQRAVEASAREKHPKQEK